jgi:hypothetical protein
VKRIPLPVLVLLARLACGADGPPLDVVLVFDRTHRPTPHSTDELSWALARDERMAVASIVPEFRIHTVLTSDSAVIDRAVEEAVSSHPIYSQKHPRLYEGARKAAALIDEVPSRSHCVVFITFNREKPSDERTRELIDYYRSKAIRLEVIVLPSARVRAGLRPPIGICDPSPGCPPLQNAIDPDLATLDQAAAATGGRVWRVNGDPKIDWQKLIGEIRADTNPVTAPRRK